MSIFKARKMLPKTSFYYIPGHDKSLFRNTGALPTCVHTHIQTDTHTDTSSLKSQPLHPSPQRQPASKQRIHDLVLEAIMLGHHCTSPTAPFSTAQLGSSAPLEGQGLRNMNSKKKVFVGLLGNAWAELQVKSHPSTHRLRGPQPGRQQVQTASHSEAALQPEEAGMEPAPLAEKGGPGTHVSSWDWSSTALWTWRSSWDHSLLGVVLAGPQTGGLTGQVNQVPQNGASGAILITPAGHAMKPPRPVRDLSSASLIPLPNLLD